jgi:hypothetical protein
MRNADAWLVIAWIVLATDISIQLLRTCGLMLDVLDRFTMQVVMNPGHQVLGRGHGVLRGVCVGLDRSSPT